MELFGSAFFYIKVFQSGQKVEVILAINANGIYTLNIKDQVCQALGKDLTQIIHVISVKYILACNEIVPFTENHQTNFIHRNQNLFI